MKRAFGLLFVFLMGTLVAHAQDGCLTSAERQLMDLINNYRATKGLGPVPYSPQLTKVAQLHVRDLQNNRPDQGECNMHSWSGNGNWTPVCYYGDHRNAAGMWNKPKEITGYPGSGFEISYMSGGGAEPQGALRAWQGSSGHNAVMVNSGIWANQRFQAMGVGIYGNYAVVWFSTVPDNATCGAGMTNTPASNTGTAGTTSGTTTGTTPSRATGSTQGTTPSRATSSTQGTTTAGSNYSNSNNQRLATSSNAPVTVNGPGSCTNLLFDIDKGTLDNVPPNASQAQFKQAFPCFTGETSEATPSLNCGGGVFFVDHTFFAYTGRDFIEIRSGFAGRQKTPLLGKARKAVETQLGQPMRVVENYAIYSRSYGSLIIGYEDNTVATVAVSTRPASSVEPCY